MVDLRAEFRGSTHAREWIRNVGVYRKEGSQKEIGEDGPMKRAGTARQLVQIVAVIRKRGSWQVPRRKLAGSKLALC